MKRHKGINFAAALLYVFRALAFTRISTEEAKRQVIDLVAVSFKMFRALAFTWTFKDRSRRREILPIWLDH